MKGTTILENQKVMIVFIIIGIAVLTKLFLASQCNWEFSFDHETCPTPISSIWIGAIIGTVYTGAFFLLIEYSNQKKIKALESLGKSKISKQRLILVVGLYIIGISLAGYVTSNGFCIVNTFGSFCPTEESEILLDVSLGISSTIIFFLWFNKHLDKGYDELAKMYLVRTCMLNFLDIFNNKNGEGRIFKTEQNRLYFLKILKDVYLAKFTPKKNESIVYDTMRMIEKHGPIFPEHDHLKCEGENSCGKITEKLLEFIKNPENVNPIEKSDDIDKNNNWMKKK
jgi:hypothetical protein